MPVKGPAKWRNVRQTSDKELRGFLGKKHRHSQGGHGGNTPQGDYSTGGYNSEEYVEEYL